METLLIVSVAVNILFCVLLIIINDSWYKDFSKMNSSWSEIFEEMNNSWSEICKKTDDEWCDMLRSYIMEKEDSDER